jgi:hypothetical protein
MRLDETLGALAHLPDDAQITITVRKADLAKALETRAGGPLIMTTTQAAHILGYTPERWRRWAQSGAIPGAYQNSEEGAWHLPRGACEQHIANLGRRGTKRQPSLVPIASPTRRPRGPWKSAAATAAQTE